MNNRQINSGAFSYGEFVWWIGIVEDRMDPLMLGRVKVRIYGYHDATPKSDLYWAMVMQPITSAASGGIGTSPTGILEGTTVFGFFADAHQANVAVVMGTLAGAPTKAANSYDSQEADTNRLSRNQKIGQTIVQKKRSDRSTAKVAFGGQWQEKATPYAAKYPHNHSKETESGHIEEFDDTPGAERINRHHRSGTFEEIHPDGTTVTKIKKDKYEIVIGDEYVKIEGKCQVNIVGNSSVLIEGNAAIEIDGNCVEKIHGNYNLEVDGNMNTKVGGNHTLNVGGNQTSTTGGIEKRNASLILLN